MGSLHTKSAWHLLRHLVDIDSTRDVARRSLQRVIRSGIDRAGIDRYRSDQVSIGIDTSWPGKMMEKAIQIRLTEYLEEQNFVPYTMYGFRPHLSAHDIFLQLKHEIVNLPSGTTQAERTILAIDFKDALDNVRHFTILEKLRELKCGPKLYAYEQDFLTDRQVTIRIRDLKSQTITMSDFGTTQGAVLSSPHSSSISPSCAFRRP